MDSGLQTQRSVQVLVGQWSANMTTYSVACWTVVYRHDNTLNCLLYSGLQTWRHILWLVGQLSTDMTRSFACWTVVYKHDDTFSGLLYSCLQTWQVQSACFRVVYKNDNTFSCLLGGAGIAQWLERRTRDWKVAGSNPCWNGGRIFFSRVDFLCWLLFRYPFHPRVTTVARKKSRSFCQKCRWQVTAKNSYTLRMWLLLNRASALVTTCP